MTVMRIWRAPRRLGRRGAVLLLFGIAWVFVGAGFALSDTDRFSRPGPGGFLQFLDDPPWPGLFWVLCGAVAVVNGLMRRRLGNEDAVGYASLIMPPALWVLAYSWSFFLWVLTRDAPEVFGRSTSILGAGLFLILVVIIWVISDWPDPSDAPAPVVPPPISSNDMVALLDRRFETRENAQDGP